MPQKRRSRRRVVVLVALCAAFAVGMLSWTIFWGALLAAHAQRAAGRFADVRAGSPAPGVAEARWDMDRLDQDLRALRVVTWMPPFRREARSARQLLDKAQHLLDAAALGTRVLDGAGISTDAVRSYADLSPAVLQRLRDALSRERGAIAALARQGRELAARSAPPSRLSRVRYMSAQLDAPVARSATLLSVLDRTGTAAFDLLGVGGPRTYLLLLQNAEEIRPGGGLISTFGVLTVRDGRVEDLDIAHVSRLALPVPGDFPESREPLRRLASPVRVIQNVNWEADASVWLSDARDFWRRADGRPVDGILVVGTPVLQDLLRLTGPLTIAEVPGAITYENVVSLVDAAMTDAYVRSPGEGDIAILRALMEDIIRRVEATPSAQWSPLAEMVERRVAARDLALFLTDPVAHAALAPLGAVEALSAPAGDELFLLDANLGSAKADAKMRRRVSLVTDARVPESAHARLHVAYDYTAARPDARTWPYRGYLRLLAPDGSRLLRFRGAQNRPDVGSESGRAVFGNYVSVDFGEEREVIVEYAAGPRVRAMLAAGSYELVLRKQGGLELPYEVTIRLPERWRDASAAATDGDVTVEWDETGGLRAQWRGILTRDTTVTVTALEVSPDVARGATD